MNNRVFETYPLINTLLNYDNLKVMNKVINKESNQFYNSLINLSKSTNTSINTIDFLKINDISLETSSLKSVN